MLMTTPMPFALFPEVLCSVLVLLPGAAFVAILVAINLKWIDPAAKVGGCCVKFWRVLMDRLP